MVNDPDRPQAGGPQLAYRVDPDPVRRVDSRVLGLYHDEAQQLFGFVRRLGLSDEHADDAVQEVLTRLMEQSQRGVMVANPRAWAFQSIYRLAMDQHRLRRRVAGLLASLGRRESPARALDATDTIAVWSEVDRLPQRQRAVIYLRYQADLRFEEIGQALGITPNAARSHATQATATLRRRLAPRLEEGQ